MGNSDLEKLLDMAEQAGIRQAFCDILRQFSGARVRIDPRVIDRQERPIFARQLLDARAPRPQVSARLMARFGVSKRTANRDIQQALNDRT